MHLLNRKIKAVHYYHINNLDHAFFYRGFHCFDLGINIQLDNDESIHIGWSVKERIELSFSKYQPEKNYEDYLTKDATQEWSEYIEREITDIKITYISRDWNIPEICTLQFDNGAFVKIVLSEYKVHPAQLPVQMEHTACASIYVFLNQEPPPIVPVRITPAKYRKIDPAQHNLVKVNLFTTRGFGLFLVVLCLAICLVQYIIQNYL